MIALRQPYSGVMPADSQCKAHHVRSVVKSPPHGTSTLLAMSDALVPDHLLLAIDHVGIAVPDLDDALEFYATTFGLHSVHEEVNEEQGVREAMLAVGDSGSCIQLLAPLSDESTIAKFLVRNGQGIQQLAYRVADIDAVSATLRERGVRLLYDAPKNGTAGSRVNFVHPKDAGGVLVELVQPGSSGH